MILDRFKNSLIKRGNKVRANNIYKKVLLKLKSVGNENIVYDLLSVLKPKIRLLNKKKGSSTLKVPGLISSSQASSLALKWFFKSVKDRSEKKLEDRIFNELMEILERKSNSLKKKEEYYKLATHNRGFLRLSRKRRR